MASPSIDVELVYDRFLNDSESYDGIARALRRHASAWCEGAVMYQSPKDQRPLDLSSSGALRDGVLGVAGERGQTYRALTEEYGRGDERLFGSVEIRGATPELTVVISVDERPVSPMGDALQLGNTVALQLRRARVEGRSAAVWASDSFRDLADATAPAWGAVSVGAEYDAKVMADGPGAAAAGRDFGRYLPGLFSINFFGLPYIDLIGRQRLLDAPGVEVTAVDGGVLIAFGDDPKAWAEPERQRLEDQVLDHLGRQYFFSKTDMPKEPTAPDWAAHPGGGTG